MIHHYLGPEEIQHLTDLHNVVMCKSCKLFRTDRNYCTEYNMCMYPMKQACDDYIEASRNSVSKRTKKIMLRNTK